MKYKFAGLIFYTLKELREALNDSARLSDEAIAREVIRIFETAAIKNDLLDWLDWQRETEVCAVLEKARSPRMFSTFLLGEDSPRLERIDGVIRSLMAEGGQGGPGGNSSDVAKPNAPLPQTLYRVVDLKDLTVSGLDEMPHGGWSDEYKTSKLVLRRIEPGTFLMGSPTGESGRSDDETQHRVTLTKPYYLGVLEVTQAQWKAVMGTDPSHFKGSARPVETVSWHDCQSFCQKMGALFRLPTEAQWEYACRAGTTTAYFWGNALNGDRANCDGNYPCGTSTKGSYKQETSNVGSYAPNAWGLYDMHGNVYEWCSDWYAAYGGDATDPVGPASGDYRVARGGSWYSYASNCRSANRNYDSPGSACNNLGFRLCCSAGPAV